MMKSKGEDAVDWEKIHSTEDEFLEIDKSIESSVESVSSKDSADDLKQPIEILQPFK